MMTKPYRMLAAILFVVLIAAGCQTAQEQATPTPIPTPIVAEKSLYTVGRGTVQRIQEFNARISPVVEVELFFESNGYVDKVFFERNDLVSAGDVIAELKQEASTNQLAQAVVSLEQADLRLEQAKEANERQLAESKINLEIKKLKLDRFKALPPDPVETLTEEAKAANERQLAESTLSLESKKLKLERFKALPPDSAETVTAEAKESYERQLADSALDLETRKLRLDKFRLQTPDTDIEIAAKRLEEANFKRAEAQGAYDRISWQPGVEATRAAQTLQSATIAYEISKATYDAALARAETYKIDLAVMERDYESAQLAHEYLKGDIEKSLADIAESAAVKVETYANDLAVMELDYDLAKLKHEYLKEDIARSLGDTTEQATIRTDTFTLDVAVMEREYELALVKHGYLEQGVDENLAKAVQQAQLNVERLETQVGKGRIVSPIDGIVTSLALTEGRDVVAFRKAAVVANTDELELAAQLSDAEMQELEVGTTVTVTLGAYPGQALIGTISQLPYPYAQGGSTAKLDQADQFTHIELADPDIVLRMGDVAKVSVLLEQAFETLWLPPAAVRNFEGRNFVVVEQDGRQRRIDIKVGIIGIDRIEVLEGLEEGQTVLGQ